MNLNVGKSLKMFFGASKKLSQLANSCPFPKKPNTYPEIQIQNVFQIPSSTSSEILKVDGIHLQLF